MKSLSSLALALVLTPSIALAQEAPKVDAPSAEKAPEPSAEKTPEETPAEAATEEKKPEASTEEAAPATKETKAEEQPTTETTSETVAETTEPAEPTYQDEYAGVENASTDDLVKTPKHSPFMLGLLWDTALPIGVTKDFVGKFSARGFAVDARYSGFGNLGLGVTLAWHVLDQKTKTTSTWENATITGTQVREISSSPFTFKATYALRDLKKKYIPYAGVGLGAARVLRRVDMGIARVTDESWHFAFVPEIGIEMPMTNITLLASTRFNYFVKGDGAPAQLYMNFSVGIGFD